MCSLFTRPRWKFFQCLVADFFLAYQGSLQTYVEHWVPTKVLLGLSGTRRVPGLVLGVSGVLSSDPATLTAKEVCASVVTVMNSFTAALRLILLPGEDIQKVGSPSAHSSLVCFRLFGLGWASTMASPVPFSTSRLVCEESRTLHSRSFSLCLIFRSKSFSLSSQWAGVPPFNSEPFQSDSDGRLWFRQVERWACFPVWS